MIPITLLHHINNNYDVLKNEYWWHVVKTHRIILCESAQAQLLTQSLLFKDTSLLLPKSLPNTDRSQKQLWLHLHVTGRGGDDTEQKLFQKTPQPLFYVAKVQIEAKAFSEICKLLFGVEAGLTGHRTAGQQPPLGLKLVKQVELGDYLCRELLQFKPIWIPPPPRFHFKLWHDNTWLMAWRSI